MGKIGIMGGTFNPIHIGHLLLAEHAGCECALDEVWFIPTGCSYMKREDSVLSGNARLKMVNLAIEGNCLFKSCDIEVRKSGYTYTYETLLALKKEYPQHSFYFIFGTDCLFTIEKWKEPDIIFDNCTIVAAVRSGASLESMEGKRLELQNKYHADILLLPFLQIDISSTDIRERIAQGKSVQYMVPKAVYEYIMQEHFYEEYGLEKN